MRNLGLDVDVAQQIIKLFDEDGSGVVEYGEFVTLAFYLNELEYLLYISFHSMYLNRKIDINMVNIPKRVK